MAKSDDILKKYGITQVRGSAKSDSSSGTNSSTQKSTGTTKADRILAKYGIIQEKDSGSSKSEQKGSTIPGYNDNDAISGWNKFLAERRKKREEEEEKSWLEKIAGWLGQSSDTTLPGANITTVTNAYREDTSYREPSDNWSISQKNDFGYLYNKSPEQAWKYAEELNNSLAKAEKEKQETAVKESATDGFWKGAAHTAGAIATAPLGLADYLDNMAEYTARGKVTEKAGMTPFDYSQKVTSSISEDLNEKHGTLDEDIPVIGGKGWGDVYGLGTSIAQSALAGYTGGQAGTLMQFFGSAAASGFDEAKQRGATDDQALTYGTLNGVAEGLAEMVGVDNLLKIGSASTMRGLLKNLLKQGAAEGLEEGLTSVMNNFADQIVMQDKSNFYILVRELMAQGMSEEEAKKKAWKSMTNDLAFDMVAGLASGIAHAGPQTAYQTTIENIYQPYWEGRTIMESEGSVDALKQLADEVAGVSSADMQQAISERTGKVNEKQSALNVGRLYETVQKANDLANASANQADIAKSLERKGFTSETASSIAEALVAQYNGQELTKAQQKVLASAKGSTAVQDAISNIMTNTKSTMGQRSDNIRSFQKDVSIGRIAKAHGMSADQVKKIAEDVFTAPEENGSESHYEVSMDGKTLDGDGNIVTIQGISSIENGRMVLQTENGTVDAGNVSYASKGEALVYEAVSKLEGIIDTETANKLSKHLLKLGGTSSKVYVNAIEQAYTYGYYGYGREAMTGKNTLSATLTEKQRNVAYGLGEQYRAARTAADQKAVSKKETTTKKASGKVHFDGNRATLTERQSASLSAMETVAEALGVQIYVFESQVDENGRRKGANGWYDPADNSIHIDLHAGATGEGTMLFTVAHELTHHIRKWSPAKFKILADFLMQEYGKKGVSVDALVRAQIAKAKRNGRTISYDTAYEEVIADSMESMLSDGKVMEKLAKLKQVDKSLWQKIKDFISEMAAKIRKVYDGLSPDSVEGRFVAEMVDSIERLQDLFTEALVDASENFQTAEKNTTNDGGDILHSLREFEDGTRFVDVQMDASTFDGMTVAEMNKAAKTILMNRFAGKVIGIDNRVFVNGDSVNEYLHPSKSIDMETRKAKLTAAGELDNLLDAGAALPNKPDGADGHIHPNAIDFSYFKTIFKVGNEYFEGIVNIVNNKRGKLLKDVTKIKNITQDIVSSYGQNPKSNFLRDVSMYSIRNESDNVKNESLEALDVAMDSDTESVAPAVLFSERTWTESDYVQEREKAAEEISKAIGVSKKKAKAYIDSVNSIAKMIAEDRVRLDYFSSPGRSSFVGNVEYGGSFDFSTLCKKRRLLTGTFTAIQKALPNTALTADEILDIRNRMKEKGLEVSCGLCYVEGSRANMGQFAKEFLRLYKQYYPDAWQPNMADVNTPDGIEWVRINHPECYEQYEYFWNHYGTLKEGDKNLFASQQKPKLYQLHTEYKGEILQKFKDDGNVEDKNLNGGIRLQSFSDFEIVHLIDTMQIIMDMSRVGLAGQAYTKVPDFAWALGDTGLKINLSLIAKGVDANGKLIFDDVEGMPIADAVALRNRYSKNVGTILVAFNDEQLLAAMADDRVDYIIPFHRSQWKKSQYGAMGLPAKTKDYTYMQNEKFIKPQYHEYRGRMVKDKATNYMPNEYWDFSKSGKENAIAYLEMCARNNKRPKFYKLLQNNGDGSYSLKADGSTDGYWKLLIDFKMYDNEGNGSPQMPVKPEFNMEEATRMLDTYKGGHSNFPVAQGIVDDFVKEYKETHKGAKFSDRDNAPTFYSHMAKVVDGVKQEKLGAASVVSMLRGKGVKAEEIKWSGIEAWLEGKKSVTKADLQEFIAGSMLQIQEEQSARGVELRFVGKDSYKLYDIAGNVLDTFKYDKQKEAYVSDATGKTYSYTYEIEDAVRREYDNQSMTRWAKYKLNGGFNYRELVFRLPNNSYSNQAMRAHWGDDAEGILAHARIQDFDTFLGKMLFVEELQSDYHNEGHEAGYADSKTEEKIEELKAIAEEKFFALEDYSTEITGMAGEWEEIEKTVKGARLLLEYNEAQNAYDQAMNEYVKKIPDAPFKDTYHEYVLKRLLRMAAEEGYDSIGWTPSEIQVKRWSEEFAEGYRIEYDQEMPKFMSKYGKKWGTKVGKTVLDSGTEVWSMAITDEMKDSVLTEGQPLYQDRDTESVSNRSLLANAFEGVAQNDMERQKIQEYKGKIDLINAEERKLQELNEKIKELSFAKGPKDTKAIRDLQFEAKQTANRISTYDKQLLRLEASKPLQDVLTREKKMAYQRAEKKGKEALAAYKEKATQTHKELLTRYQESRKKGIENRHRTEMRHKIKYMVSELNQYLLNGTKDKRVMMGLKKAVAEALDAVNMDTVGAEERIAKLQAEMMKAKTPEAIQEIARKIDHIQQMGDKMSNRLKALKDAYREIAESDDPLIANAHDDVIEAKLESVIEKVGNTPLRDMNLSQLEEVYDMYRMVLTTIRNSNKAFKAAKNESIAVLGNRVMEEVDKVGGKRKYNLAAAEAIKKFAWNNLKPVYAFQHIGSDTFAEVFNNVRAGEDVWAVDVTEAREFYLDKSKKYKYDSWNFDKRYTFTSSSGMNFSLNLEQIMSLYAYSKREQAAEHLQRGGIVIDESTEITMKTKMGFKAKFNPTEATAYNISEETLGEITSKLTEDQRQFVDEMQEYLSTTMGAKGNEVSLELYGIKLFKEKFYFPLKSASQFMAKAKEQQQGEVKIKNSGFSKETVRKASNPIVLTPFMDVWSNHVNEMSMYHAFVLPMEDFYRVWSYRTPTSDTMATESVEMFIQNAYGKGATKYIDQLLKDLNGGARTDSTTGVINKMMGMFKKGAVFASLSVVVQQPSAIARAAALVDTKHFIGPKVDHKRHKALWNEVKQYAPVAIIKEMGYFDTNMGKSTQDFILAKEYSGISEKMKALFTDSGYRDEILSKAPALADEMAWCSIWEAVKRETKSRNKGMDVKSEAFLKMCGERFTEVIVKTQVYDSVLSRSANMRSKDTGMKMATAFMAEPTTSINMIADALLQGKRGNKKYCRAAIGAVIASQILNSILVSFVYAARDDDEDKTYWEKYIGTLSSEILDSLNPGGYIPFIKDIVSIVQGYDVERSDMAVVSDLWNAYKKLGNENLSVYRKVEGFAGSIAQIFGLPVKNIMRDVRGIYQTINSFVNGQLTTEAGIGYAVKSAVPKWIGGGEVSDKEQLYVAYLSGDTDHLNRVMSRYEDQDAVNSAMRSAIKEHFTAGDINSDTAISYLVKYAGLEEDDAYWKVEEWEYENATGEDFGKYNEFFTAVETGKNLRAVIKQYTDNGVEMRTLSSQITSHFKPLYKEMSSSERAKIKGYLINAMMVLGDTREDAEEDIAKWQYEADYPELSDRITYTQYKRWQADGKPNGVSLDLYTDVAEYRDDGTSSSAKSQEDVAAYIDSLPISTAQKDALWCCFWKESTLKKAPWH